MKFASSPEPTLGVEIELALVDERTMALTSAVEAVRGRLPEEHLSNVKPELMQCYIETNSAKCRTVAEVEADLRPRLRALETAARQAGTRLLWSGTHLFSKWDEQEVSDNARYHGLVNLLQDTARQLITFGLHVHVGVDSGDKAIMICDRIMRHLPFFARAQLEQPVLEWPRDGPAFVAFAGDGWPADGGPAADDAQLERIRVAGQSPDRNGLHRDHSRDLVGRATAS